MFFFLSEEMNDIIDRRDFLNKKLFNYIEFSEDIPFNDEVFKETSDELKELNEGIIDWIKNKLKKETPDERIIRILKSGSIGSNVQWKDSSKPPFYDLRKGATNRIEVHLLLYIKREFNEQAPKNINELETHPNLKKWFQENLFETKVPNSKNDTITDMCRDFALGGKTKTPAIFNGSDSQMIVKVITEEKEALNEFSNSVSGHLEEIQHWRKTAESRKDNEAYRICLFKKALFNMLLEGYCDGKLNLIDRFYDIAEYFVSQSKKR